jgi:hypothetical protein
LQSINGTPAVKLDRKATDLEELGNPYGRSPDIMEPPPRHDTGPSDPPSTVSPATKSGATKPLANSRLAGTEEGQVQKPLTTTLDQNLESKEPEDFQPASPLNKRPTDASTNSKIRLVLSTSTQSSARINSFASISEIPGKEVLVFDKSKNKWRTKRKQEIRGEPMYYLLSILCNNNIV